MTGTREKHTNGQRAGHRGASPDAGGPFPNLPAATVKVLNVL